MSGIAVAVLGGTIIDQIWKYKTEPVQGTCTHASKETIVGGVGLNIARHLKNLGNQVIISCVVGKDAEGRQVVEYVQSYSIDRLIIVSDRVPTGSFVGMHKPNGEVALAAVDKSVYTDLSPTVLEGYLPALQKYKTWVLDSSFSRSVFAYLSDVATNQNIYLVMCGADEAANVTPILARLDGLFCNSEEVLALASELAKKPVDDVKIALNLVAATGIKKLVVTDGANGVYVVFPGGAQRFFEVPPADVVCVNGAGDALAAVTIDALCQGIGIFAAIARGLEAAKLQVEGKSSQIGGGLKSLNTALSASYKLKSSSSKL